MRNSLYWDLFEKRIDETVDAIKNGKPVPVRRVAVFVTGACNMKCKYCKDKSRQTMTQRQLEAAMERHPDAILHLTGGEPSVVPWLYPFIERHCSERTFHLNSNMAKPAPYHAVRRLKVSLDTDDPRYFAEVTGRDCFADVVQNIKDAAATTVTSITCTVTRQNITNLQRFAEFCSKQFPGLYAVFFSIYKGSNQDFVIPPRMAREFMETTKPALMGILNAESSALMDETIDEKRRLLQGVRYPENAPVPCYISLSERVVDAEGESACSHLYRDGQRNKPMEKRWNCLYGCNRRLTMFNEEVARRLGVKVSR
jgi:MoaA/NifB/PqqE/SkfB family radical SAM enzyme